MKEQAATVALLPAGAEIRASRASGGARGNTLLTAMIVALAAMPGAFADADERGAMTHRLVVITGRNEALSDLALDDFRRIYLGRIHRLGGHRITPVILRGSEPAEQYFLRHIAGMAEIDFTQVWIGAVFRGEVSAPPRLARSPAEACQFVATHAHTIAFIDAIDLNDSVKTITIDGRAYDAPDYPLKWTRGD
jgi:hypothetical protein